MMHIKAAVILKTASSYLDSWSLCTYESARVIQWGSIWRTSADFSTLMFIILVHNSIRRRQGVRWGQDLLLERGLHGICACPAQVADKCIYHCEGWHDGDVVFCQVTLMLFRFSHSVCRRLHFWSALDHGDQLKRTWVSMLVRDC